VSYIVAVIVQEGIVALADTRITTGTEKRFDEKIWTDGSDRFFALFAGNRFWTDEVLLRLRQPLLWQNIQTVREFADWLGEELINIKKHRAKLLAEEDSALQFDIGLIVGGRGPADERQDIRLVYQAGNHVTYSEFTPYHFSGVTAYGKFILDDGVFYRSFEAEGFGAASTLREAVSATLLSLHATQSSVTSVDYPVHLLICPREGAWQRNFLRQSRLKPFRQAWQTYLHKFLNEAPLPDGIDSLLHEKEQGPASS